MMKSIEKFDDNFNVRDVVYGVVTGGCGKGLYLTLENGTEAFANFGGLAPGSEVLCSVIKKANGNLSVLVSIDSVLNAVSMVA